MRIGVFSVIFQQLPFEQAIDKILSYGATAVEIGTGGLPGAHHCNLDELLESAEKRKAYLKAVENPGNDNQRVQLPLGSDRPGQESSCCF